MELVDVGYGNMINAIRIVAVVSADAAPSRRLIATSRERNLLVDASSGRKTKTLYVMDSGHVILSAKAPVQEVKERDVKETVKRTNKPRAKA